ncbi:MAG: LTA synthase family protein [Bacteroidaceae bacterium]|nr:LTA synthase family protein [Bacteroidaceae bacterium]
MKSRILFLLRTYVTTVALFLVAKIVFMLANRADHPFHVGDIGNVLRHGLTLDLSTALYFLVPPLLLTFVSLWCTGRGLRRAMRGWFLLAALAFSLAFIADTALYPHWGFKLDATCLQYLATPIAAAASVPGWQLLLGFFLLICLMGLFSLLFLWRMPQFKPLKDKRPGLLLLLLLLPLTFVGMRGGLDESTTNIGQVYYSQTPFLNHSAVNPVFSFLSSFEGTVRTDVRYSFFPDDECAGLLQDIFTTESLGNDTLLTTPRPHIVVVMMESCGGQFTMIGGRRDITPNLNRLADEGIYFSRCYANSFRTDRATVCIWGGYPSFPTMSLQKDLTKNAHLPAIARTLRQSGYTTNYYYGGDINFTKMRSYLINAGFEHLSSQNDYPRELRHESKWGVRDDVVFNRVADEIATWSPADTVPHLIGYTTLSSHEPWEVPHHELDDPVENSFHYLDHCIGQFIDRLRQLPVWDRLLVILLPDHGVNYAGLDENSELKMHIPMLWLGGAVKAPRTVDALCNQTDLAATLLGQLQLPHDDFLFSRDVLSHTYRRPMAFHTFNNGFSMVDSTGFLVFDLTADRPVVGNDERKIRLGKAILQETSRDLSEK